MLTSGGNISTILTNEIGTMPMLVMLRKMHMHSSGIKMNTNGVGDLSSTANSAKAIASNAVPIHEMISK